MRVLALLSLINIETRTPSKLDVNKFTYKLERAENKSIRMENMTENRRFMLKSYAEDSQLRGVYI